MSTALQRASERYALAPRKLDALLERKARGDRGCLFDIGSGLGILTTFGCLIASQMGLIAFNWTYVGVALWIGTYFTGAYAQAKSSKTRQHALETGPLVPAIVISCEEHLRQRNNKRSGRALILFALVDEMEPSARHKHAAGLLEDKFPDQASGPLAEALCKTLQDEFCFDFVRLDPQLLDSLGVSSTSAAGDANDVEELYATRVVVDPEQLDAGVLQPGDDLAVIVHIESVIAEVV